MGEISMLLDFLILILQFRMLLCYFELRREAYHLFKAWGLEKSKFIPESPLPFYLSTF